MENWCAVHSINGTDVLVSWVIRDDGEGNIRSRFRTEFYPSEGGDNSLVTLMEREEDMTQPFTQKDWELYKNAAVTEKRVTEFLTRKNP